MGENWNKLEKIKASMLNGSKVLTQLNASKKSTYDKLTAMNDEIKQYDDEIVELEKRMNELKRLRNATQNEMDEHIMPLIQTQEQCVDSALEKIKHQNDEKIGLEKQLTHLKETTHSIHKFDEDMAFIIGYLENEFKTKFEPKWEEWSAEDVLVWLRYLNILYENNDQFAFKNEHNKALLMNGVVSSNLAGKDLKNINDLILRSFDIKENDDRKVILQSLNVLMSQLDPESDAQDKSKDDDDQKNDVTKEQDRQCVICMDSTANMMFQPCNHIAACQQCYAEKAFDKCAFCGGAIDKVIKIYHVGF